MTLTAAVHTADPPKCPNPANPVSNGATPAVLVPVSTTALDRGSSSVLALLGDVGTPTAIRAAPVAIETGTLLFGAITGATTLLRDTSSGWCSKYIFNVRASYAQEADATLAFFLEEGVPANYQDVMSFDQSDTFGQAGYNGLMAAYIAQVGPFPTSGLPDPTNPIPRFQYTRNEPTTVAPAALAAEAYIASRLESTTGPLSIGIMMTDVYGAGTQFITTLRTWQFDGLDDGQGSGTLATDKATRLTLYFSNLSFVGPNALSQNLVAAGTVPNAPNAMPFTTNVVVSNVVPNYQTDQSDVVLQYNKLIEAAG